MIKKKKRALNAVSVPVEALLLAAGEISHPQTNQNDQLGTG